MRAHLILWAALAAPRACGADDSQIFAAAQGALQVGSQLANLGGAQGVSQAGVKEKEKQLKAVKELKESAAALEQGRRASWNEIFQNWQKYIDQLKAELRRLEDEKRKKEQELAAELAKPPESQDQAKIQRLRKEIEELRKKIEALKKKIAEEEAKLAQHRQLAAQAEQLRPQAEQNPAAADQIRALAGQASDQGVNRDLSLFADAVKIAAAAKKDQEAIEKELEELKKMAAKDQQNGQQMATQQQAPASTITGSSPQASYPTPSYMPAPPVAASEGGQAPQRIGRADFDRAPQTGGMGSAAPRKVAGGPGNESDITTKGAGAVPTGASPRDSSAITGHGSDVEGGYNKPRAELAGFTATGNLGGGLPGGMPTTPGPKSAEEHLAGLGGPEGSSTAVTGAGASPGSSGSFATGSSGGAVVGGLPFMSTAHAEPAPREPLGKLLALDVLDEDSTSLFRRVRLVHNRCESFGCVRYGR